MAIEIPLNQFFKLGPFLTSLNFCKILVANLNSHENGDECQRAVIHTLWLNRCCLTPFIA